MCSAHSVCTSTKHLLSEGNALYETLVKRISANTIRLVCQQCSMLVGTIQKRRAAATTEKKDYKIVEVQWALGNAFQAFFEYQLRVCCERSALRKIAQTTAQCASVRRTYSASHSNVIPRFRAASSICADLLAAARQTRTTYILTKIQCSFAVSLSMCGRTRNEWTIAIERGSYNKTHSKDGRQMNERIREKMELELRVTNAVHHIHKLNFDVNYLPICRRFH